MKKADAKREIEKLFEVWKTEMDVKPQGPYGLMEAAYFITWLKKGPHAHLLKFRATMGAEWCVEHWFDEYFRQSWRN